MKLAEQRKAISLRKKGLSYRSIQKRLPISRSSLNRWLKDIRLTQKQLMNLQSNRKKGRMKGAFIKKMNRIQKTNRLLQLGETEFFRFSKNALFLSGLLLYWAEGDKHKEESVKFTNADPSMISLMMQWFRKICHVPEKKFRIALHIHNLHNPKTVNIYWSKLTGIPIHQFHKNYIKKSSLRFRKNILYNGTCAIIVNNKDLFRKIMGWKNGLLKFFKLTPRSSMDRTKDF